MTTAAADDIIDHAPCAAIATEVDTRHWCWREKGHEGAHECSCGRFWPNLGSMIVLGFE